LVVEQIRLLDAGSGGGLFENFNSPDKNVPDEVGNSSSTTICHVPFGFWLLLNVFSD
jgi:hypothetical protein